jgi:hypothetical protein
MGFSRFVEVFTIREANVETFPCTAGLEPVFSLRVFVLAGFYRLLLFVCLAIRLVLLYFLDG